MLSTVYGGACYRRPAVCGAANQFVDRGYERRGSSGHSCAVLVVSRCGGSYPPDAKAMVLEAVAVLRCTTPQAWTVEAASALGRVMSAMDSAVASHTARPAGTVSSDVFTDAVSASVSSPQAWV